MHYGAIRVLVINSRRGGIREHSVRRIPLARLILYSANIKGRHPGKRGCRSCSGHVRLRTGRKGQTQLKQGRPILCGAERRECQISYTLIYLLAERWMRMSTSMEIIVTRCDET